MEDLPPLEPNKSRLPKAFVLSVLAFSILMLTLPMGVYLVQNQTNILPRAQTPKTAPRQTGFQLFKSPINGYLPISLMVYSDIDSANLFVARLKFPQEKLEVLSIAPDSANFRWIDAKFDNEKGTISAVAGVAQPGLKTDPAKTQTLATINFKAKKEGPAQISFGEDSAIFRNSDNLNILSLKDPLSLEIDEDLILGQSEAAPLVSKEANLILESPKAGEVYLYNKEIPIRWSSKEASKVVLSLYLNGLLLGEIAQASASASTYLWNPMKSLPIVYVSDENSFEIEISSNFEGKIIKDTAGPFEILARSNLPQVIFDPSNLSQSSTDFNQDSKTNLLDLSLLLSNMFLDGADKKYDLNGDGIVNGLDLWLMSEVLTRLI